jgi:HK97 family phage prohead protease
VDYERADFQLGIKAAEIREDENGDLLIEGYASDFETDRDMEAFEPAAFDRGLAAFMANPVLLEHHKPDRQLGIVESAELSGKGLRIRGRVMKPPAGSWAEHPFDLIKRGYMRGFSVGGAFKRRMTTAGPRIFDVDLQEISITPLPVNPRTLFATAQKAFATESDEPELEALAAVVAGLDTLFNTLAEAA